MKQCFGYVRVSTQKQGEGVSLEAQRSAIEQFAARSDIAIIEWFEEKQTAAKGGRPVFGAMLKALRRRKAAGVVMHKIDRSARNFADWAKIGDLADTGIDVHFATETLDFRSRGGRLSADIQAVIAADYIRNLREETIKGIDGRLAQGFYPFKAPIGYRDNGGGKLKTPDPVKAPLVREAFRLYATGQHTVRSLCAEMAKRGLRNGWGRPLTKTGIDEMLGNPFYVGIMRVKRRRATFKGGHEPLISPVLFQQAQEVRLGRYAKKITRHNHTYRGLFRCGSCQAPITPELHKGRVYYRCQTRSCPTTCIREDRLEQAIHEALSSVHLTEEQIAEVSEYVIAWFDADNASDAEAAVQLQVAQIDARFEALTDALIDRMIDSHTYASRKERMLLERAQLEERLRDLQKRDDHPRLVCRFLELAKSLADTFYFSAPAEKRQIVELAILNRRIHGKNLNLQPASWLLAAENAILGLRCALSRDTSRTSDSTAGDHVKKLVDLALSSEVASIYGGGVGSESESDDDLALTT